MFEKLLAFFASEKQRRCHAPLHARLVGETVVLRPLDIRDGHDWTQLRDVSRTFLQPWEPQWPKEASNREFYAKHWQRLVRRWMQDREYCFAITLRDTGALVGGITLNDVQRNARASATLGYWMGVPYLRNGYAYEAAQLILRFGFSQLHLQRIEASCMPENEASLRLLAKLGMREIGMAKNYMQINGAWRDHYMFEVVKAENAPVSSRLI